MRPLVYIIVPENSTTTLRDPGRRGRPIGRNELAKEQSGAPAGDHLTQALYVWPERKGAASVSRGGTTSTRRDQNATACAPTLQEREKERNRQRRDLRRGGELGQESQNEGKQVERQDSIYPPRQRPAK